MLEYLLTGCSEVVGCGEVTSARFADYNTRKCSCRRIARECSVWCLLAEILGDREPPSHEWLDLRLLEHVDSQYAAMIDSSKTAWQQAAAPFTLRHAIEGEFQLVHIVRDPRAVCWSLLKKNRRADDQSSETAVLIKTVLGWYYANLVCEYFGWRFAPQYRRVRYEDLARHPRIEVVSLLSKLLPTARWEPKSIGTGDNRHQLYGNRMRRKPLQIENIRIDEEWRTEMPRSLQKLVGSLSWPLRARYDYR